MGHQHYERGNGWFNSGDTSFNNQYWRDDYKEEYAHKHGRYVEIDLRKTKSIEDAIDILENGIGWISNHAANLTMCSGDFNTLSSH